MILLALALAAHAAVVDARLPRAPADVWRVRWSRALVAPDTLEWKVREPAGPAVDALTGVVVTGTRDGVLRARTPDGRALWAFQAEAGFPATPLVANGVVYAGSSDGRLYALELGRREPSSSTGFTIRGAAGPTVDGGLVFGAFSDGTVVALDAGSGAVKWQRKVGPEGQFADVDSTPVVRDGRVYLAAYSGAVSALDAASGREIWSFRTPGAARVALAGDTVVAVTTTQVIGLSRPDGAVLWSAPLAGEPAGAPVVAGDRVFVPAVKALAAFDAKSGRRLVTFDPGTGVSASPALRERRLYVLSNGGTLVAVDLR